MKVVRRLAGVVVLGVAPVMLIAGCGGDASSTGTSSGTVTLEYFGWVPSLEKSVDLWNRKNPQVQVKLIRTGGEAETNPKIRAAVQAGNAPCLSQLPLDKVASYVADGLLEPITKEASGVKDQFVPFAWQQVNLGGQTYGIPQDTGPMVMFYRTDLYKSAGLKPPSTWAEYAEQAHVVHQQNPKRYLGFFGVDDNLTWSGYAWQGGAKWFSLNEKGWTVGLDDAKTTRVAQYWQGLIDDGSIPAVNRWDPATYKELTTGKYLTFIGASWNASLLAANAADSAGKWAVAPLPKWPDGNDSANAGGSAVVTLKGCRHTTEAVKFATWLNTSEDSMNILASPQGGGLYPAAKAALSYAVVNQNVDFFGGQNIYETFRKSAQGVNQDWVWGPTYAETATVITDGFGKAAVKKTTLDSVMKNAQQQTIKDMKTRGINVQPAP